MPHIATPHHIPGIRGLMNVRPDAALALNQLVQALLVDDSPLSRGERELIASFVSHRNDCTFCKTSHGTIASHLPGVDHALVHDVWHDHANADVSNKHVDGLGATTPDDPAFYGRIGRQRAAEGYLTKSVLMK